MRVALEQRLQGIGVVRLEDRIAADGHVGSANRGDRGAAVRSALAVRERACRVASASSQLSMPYPGASSAILSLQASQRCGKQRLSRSSMIGAAVEAPGDAPNSPPMEPSLCVITSVP